MQKKWQDRIQIDQDIHHGEACIRGTRIPVRVLIASLADGMDFSEILENYPQLTEQDLLAALSYAADILRSEAFFPLSN